MKFDFPQVDLPCEILAWNDVTEDILNIYKQSCRLKAGIFAICTEGKMTATINLIDYEIKPNDLITLLPGTIIQFRERTEKVRLCFAGFSSECVERINLIKSMVSSFSKITECPIVFTELPQCFVLWKIFQEICRHESAGIQKQLTTFSGKDIQNPFLPQRAESNTEQTSNYG